MSETAAATDLQLLARYARNHDEDAFTELVRRHVNLVHSAALRQVRSPQIAEEVAQSAFTDLARNAAKLMNAPSGRPVLTAWLYQVTRRTAIDVVRRETRRQLREQIAIEMNANNNTEATWTQIEPLLDEAMDALDETDRAAVLLRYFETKSLREVSQTLGTSEDAAQKRVSRAVERLREFFSKRSTAIGASGLAAAIADNAVQAAPAGLAVSISTAALAGTGIVATTIATQTTMNWISLKSATAIVAAAVVAGTGTHLVQLREANHLRNENQNLLAQQKQLTAERDSALLASGASNDEMERLRQNQNELLRLRGEVGLLRQQSKELDRLKQENQGLRSSLAEAAAASASKATDPDADPFRQGAIAKMNDAKQLVLGLMLFAEDNEHQLPVDFNQSSNYWGGANSVLTSTNQFELVLQGSLTNVASPSTTIAVREREAWFAKGKWFKTYGFADGHSEVHTEPDGDFEAWEKQRLILQPGR